MRHFSDWRLEPASSASFEVILERADEASIVPGGVRRS